MTELQTLEVVETTTRPYTGEPGDSERMAHYVDKEALGRSIFEGTAVEALCGKVWTPTRDAARFPVCDRCQALYETTIDDLSGGGE